MKLTGVVWTDDRASRARNAWRIFLEWPLWHPRPAEVVGARTASSRWPGDTPPARYRGPPRGARPRPDPAPPRASAMGVRADPGRRGRGPRGCRCGRPGLPSPGARHRPHAPTPDVRACPPGRSRPRARGGRRSGPREARQAGVRGGGSGGARAWATGADPSPQGIGEQGPGHDTSPLRVTIARARETHAHDLFFSVSNGGMPVQCGNRGGQNVSWWLSMKIDLAMASTIPTMTTTTIMRRTVTRWWGSLMARAPMGLASKSVLYSNRSGSGPT